MLPNFLESIDPDDNYFNNFFACTDQNIQSDYFSVDKLNGVFNGNNNQNFFLVNCNIQSFQAKYDALMCTLQSLDYAPSILILTETWLDSNKALCANIDAYTAFHVTRPTAIGGGVSIFVCSDISARKLDDISFSNITIEILTVELRLNDYIFNIVALYRPHSDSIDNFNDIFLNYI